ncbi:MAG: Mrp/NBP35 family ATP-binding protein [Puia sp.]|nr:Mrp/NBP35 family ATP-binding protein [Puia sp.]
MTTEKVLEALSNVQEPDLGKDIVTLNMVKDIQIEGNYVSFTVVLTTPACPMKDMIKNACINAIRLLINKEATVNVRFTSHTSTKRKEGDSLLPRVKNIIAVVSGKGGVGKSTVAANFALALSAGGASVGLMDADIYGPSVPIMFGVRGERPKMMAGGEGGKGLIVPLEKYGIKLMSIGLLVDEKSAVVWRGPMASSAIRQFVTDVYWDELDYLVIDMPPGTGDIHLTLMQIVPVTGVIVVTTPQDVALADAKKGIAMFGQAQLKVPVIGLVENMSYFIPPHAAGGGATGSGTTGGSGATGGSGTTDNRYYIFGKDGGKKLAEEYDIPFLGQIPLVQGIREGGDTGVPAMVGDDPATRKAFLEFAGSAVRSIAMLNANIGVARVTERIEGYERDRARDEALTKF